MNYIEIVRLASRTIVSLLIAIVFLFVLVVASAQQEALSALNATNTGLSYSVARRTVSLADNDRAEQARLQKVNASLRADTRNFEHQKFQSSSDLFRRLQVVDLVARAIIKSGRCDALPTGTALTAAPDLSLWKQVQLCAQDGSIPPAVAGQIKELLAPDADPGAIQQTLDRLDRDIKDNNDIRATNDAEIDRLQKSVTSAELVRNALQDVSILDENPIVKTLRLTSLPPRVFPIVLSFVSGLFGALLLTLILSVYPDSDLHFTRSESYWSRILLGGLIAVGLFVVLGGGLATIGSNEAVAGGDTNFMFFCAIGILAGMFSERVAGYLSRNADRFDQPAPHQPKRAGTNRSQTDPNRAPATPASGKQGAARSTNRREAAAPTDGRDSAPPSDQDRSPENENP